LLTNKLIADASIWLLDSQSVDDATLNRGLVWLNPGERQRYHRFARTLRQRQFLIGRMMLRIALGRLLRVPAKSISLTERTGNAPLLNWQAPLPGFSLSHSGHWVACAVSSGTALGLDIELIDPARDFDGLAEQAFDADELVLFRQTNAAEQAAAFYELWSTKEAKFKLASSTTSKNCGSCFVITHPDLSIVLCSENVLSGAPRVDNSSSFA
jgi:4'-phosphopantetheinyl transferase